MDTLKEIEKLSYDLTAASITDDWGLWFVERKYGRPAIIFYTSIRNPMDLKDEPDARSAITQEAQKRGFARPTKNQSGWWEAAGPEMKGRLIAVKMSAPVGTKFSKYKFETTLENLTSGPYENE